MTERKYTAQQAAEGVLFYDALKSVPEDKQGILSRGHIAQNLSRKTKKTTL